MKGMRASKSEEPNDRLTRLCDAMSRAYEAHPEQGEEKVIIFMQDGNRGGLELIGYDDDSEAVTDLIVHLAAILKTNGLTLQLVPVPVGHG